MFWSLWICGLCSFDRFSVKGFFPPRSSITHAKFAKVTTHISWLKLKLVKSQR
jgi:hypothetical protein